MKKNTILVFGAAGFIGTYLIDELINNGYEVTASDNNNFGKEYYESKGIKYVSIDITNQNDFNQINTIQFDFVIHLAALQPATFNEKTTSVNEYVNVNTNGTINILEFCKNNSVDKLIYASSHRNTSGLWKDNFPIKESDGRSQEYFGEYAMFSISESAAQDCVFFYGENYNLDTIIFRLPPVYGYGPHLDIFKNGKPIKTGFQTFIDNAKQNIPIEIWGDVSVGRDIIYVKDVVDAYIKALNTNNIKGLYNISTGYKLTLKEEIETIANVFWKSENGPNYIFMPEKRHTMDSFVYDNTKAFRDFKWKPKFSFEELLYDYEKEVNNNRFGYLVEKRKNMFN